MMLQGWVREAFCSGNPGGRKDVRELRQWLVHQLQQAGHRSPGEEGNAVVSLKDAEHALDSYNAAFHELTRQVWSSPCYVHTRISAECQVHGLSRLIWVVFRCRESTRWARHMCVHWCI
jgi:hypothetical protein